MARRNFLWSLLLLLTLVLALSARVVRAQDDVEDEEDAPAEFESAPDADADEAAASVVRSEGEEEEEEGPSSIFGKAPGIETVAYFPNHPAKICPAGEEIELLLGINNGATTDLYVGSMYSTLRLPADHRVVAQNFTNQWVNMTIAAGSQATFSYVFIIDKRMRPQDLSLSSLVTYAVDGTAYTTMFYNSTIEVTEPRGVVSGESIFLVALGLGLMGLGAVWLWGQYQKLTRKRGNSAKKVEIGTRGSDASTNEWLKGTSLDVKPKAPKTPVAKTKKKAA